MTTPSAIFNEIEPYACDWLENLVGAGLIAQGRVERRSICDLTLEDVRGPGQRHFFAGIGVWSRALRLAGWPDDLLDVWTGSCPCQPFSQAGKGKGEEDERHLWPVWFKLIAECKPAVVFGEQVASKAGLAWLDTVFADLEGAGYAVAAADLCAACVGAPHIRQRLFFVGIRKDVLGNARLPRSWRNAGAVPRAQGEGEGERFGTGSVADLALVASAARVVGDAAGARRHGREDAGADRDDAGAHGCGRLESERAGATRLVADSECDGRRTGWLGASHGRSSIESDRHSDARALADNDNDGSQGVGSVRVRVDGDAQHGLDPNGRSPVGGFWADAEWIPCRDGKARPAQRESFPLADGPPTRVAADGSVETQTRGGALKAYGNAIVAEVAAEFIGAVIDILVEAGAKTGSTTSST